MNKQPLNGMLFDDAPRTYTGYARRAETSFNFLNRSARPDFSATRDTVEAMFAGFPESGKADLRARFRSKDEAHSGAFFEIFLYTVLRKMGHAPALHPSSGSNNRRVDFQIEAAGRSIFIEARTLTSTQENSQGNRLLAPVLDAIDDLESPNFFLHVDTEGDLKKAIAAEPIKRHLTAWLGSLDYEKIKAEAAGENGHRNFPVTKWVQDGCTLEFTAFPRGKARGKIGRAIGMEGGAAGWSDTGHRLRKMLAAKARRYGKLNAPYVIAVNVMDGGMDNEDALQALYGQEAVQFRTYPDGRRESRSIRQPNGLWRQHDGPRYKRVSAVLIASRLRPWCMPQSRLSLYLNPWADFPLASEFSDLEVVRLGKDGHLVRTGEPILSSALCSGAILRV